MTGLHLAYLCLQATTEGQASHAHVHEIISGLERRGYAVELFQPSYAGTTSPAPVLRLAEFDRTQRRLTAALRQGRFDALYVRAHALAYPASRAARRMGIPVLQECNGPYADLYAAWPSLRPLAGVLDRLMRTQFSDADARIAVTPELAAWLHDETGKDAYVIGNGANTEVFRPDAPNRFADRLPSRYAVFFGALTPWQRIDVLLDAVRCPEWPSDVALVVAGTGMLAESVAAAAGESTRVIALGAVPYLQVPGLVAGSLCSLVLSNERSGSGVSPIKLYESMACGVPVVVDALQGPASTVQEFDCGIVVDSATPTAVASAVATLAQHPERAAHLGHRGAAAAREHFSWDVRATQTAEVIERTIRAGSRR